MRASGSSRADADAPAAPPVAPAEARDEVEPAAAPVEAGPIEAAPAEAVPVEAAPVEAVPFHEHADANLPECPESFVDVPPEVWILRFVPTHDDYLPPGSAFPTRLAFVTSSGDKQEAQARGREPSVSVWDRRRATVAQVRALRPTPKPQRVFEVQVGRVIATGQVAGAPRLRVLTDPIVPSIGPGSSGHCGIEGCATPPKGIQGFTKVEHKAMLDKLAQACTAVNE